MTKYGILARRKETSDFGFAQRWYQKDGKPILFVTSIHAEKYAKQPWAKMESPH